MEEMMLNILKDVEFQLTKIGRMMSDSGRTNPKDTAGRLSHD